MPVPVYAENNKFRGPETPKFAYTTAPTPATYDQSLKVGAAGWCRHTHPAQWLPSSLCVCDMQRRDRGFPM